MKKIFLLYLAIILAGSALAMWYVWSLDTETDEASVGSSLTAAISSESFDAPIGAGDHAGTEGPWARRILGAYSDDGLVWTKTETVISDQADVPSLVLDGNGVLYMYYYGWTVGTKQNVPAVAISEDNGANWTFHYLSFTGFPERGDVADPEVIYEDGVFRIYGTTRNGGFAHILYGEGTDGFNFNYEGVAFQPVGQDAGVASVYRVSDGWRLFSLSSLGISGSGKNIGMHWFTSSTDGKTFVLKDEVNFIADGKNYFHGNVISVPGGYRAYLFRDGTNGIRSWFSEDGEQWVLEDGTRMNLDVATGLEEGYVGDPDIILLPNGRYFMAYATLIP